MEHRISVFARPTSRSSVDHGLDERVLVTVPFRPDDDEPDPWEEAWGAAPPRRIFPVTGAGATTAATGWGADPALAGSGLPV